MAFYEDTEHGRVLAQQDDVTPTKAELLEMAAALESGGHKLARVTCPQWALENLTKQSDGVGSVFDLADLFPGVGIHFVADGDLVVETSLRPAAVSV